MPRVANVFEARMKASLDKCRYKRDLHTAARTCPASIRDFRALEPADPICQIVAAMREGRVLEVNGHLHLPGGLLWPGANNKVLFVRKFYAPLLEHVLKFMKRYDPATEDESRQRRIVTGQSGIGKTMWM